MQNNDIASRSSPVDASRPTYRNPIPTSLLHMTLFSGLYVWKQYCEAKEGCIGMRILVVFVHLVLLAHCRHYMHLASDFFFYTSEIRSTVQRYGRQHVNSCKLIQNMSPVQ